MNDLLTRSFHSQIEPVPRDLELGSYQQDDTHADTDNGRAKGKTKASHMQGQESQAAESLMAAFYEEEGAIRREMSKVRELLAKLQQANEDSKALTSSESMKALRTRMDALASDVLRTAKLIKGKLQGLCNANAAARLAPGCEPGSAPDRTRTTLTHSLMVALDGLMKDFHALRDQIGLDYKETVHRRIYAITGQHATDDTIDDLIQSGGSETLIQNAIKDQGRGHIMETIKEIQERHTTVQDIERNLLELHQIFLDIAVLVNTQQTQLDSIETAVSNTKDYVEKGTEMVYKAKRLQRNTRKWKCIAIIILLIILIVILAPTLTTLLKK